MADGILFRLRLLGLVFRRLDHIPALVVMGLAADAADIGQPEGDDDADSAAPRVRAV
jgi:hypothetical protein